MGMLIHRHSNPVSNTNNTPQAEITSKPVDVVIEAEKNEIPESKTLTKTDINRMSKEDLIVLATEKGIEDVEEKSGMELKKILIDLL